MHEVQALAIDLATTNSTACALGPVGNPIAIKDLQGDSQIMTKFYLPPNGDPPLFGRAAHEAGAVDPANFISDIKSKIDSDEIVLNGMTRADIAIKFIEHLKLRVEAQIGREIDSAVVTVPANSTDSKRKATISCFKRAGIEPLLVVSEPCAAAFGYCRDRLGRTDSETMCVIDGGGGTFDFTIIERKGSLLTELASSGRSVGGNDFDDALCKLCLEKFATETKTSIDFDTLSPFEQFDLKERIEKAKRSLNVQSSVNIIVDHDGVRVPINVTQTEFQNAVEHLLQEISQCLDQALADSGISAKEVNRTLGVGGMSHCKVVRDHLASKDITLHSDVDAEFATCFGASWMAVEQLKNAEGIDVRHLPEPNVTMRRVTANSIGVLVTDLSGPEERKTCSVVLPRGTQIPASKPEHFFLKDENQTAVSIVVVEGEESVEESSCRVIATVELEELPTESIRSKRIEIHFSIDDDGCATLFAKDIVSGKEAKIDFDYSGGIDE